MEIAAPELPQIEQEIYCENFAMAFLEALLRNPCRLFSVTQLIKRLRISLARHLVAIDKENDAVQRFYYDLQNQDSSGLRMTEKEFLQSINNGQFLKKLTIAKSESEALYLRLDKRRISYLKICDVQTQVKLYKNLTQQKTIGVEKCHRVIKSVMFRKIPSRALSGRV